MFPTFLKEIPRVLETYKLKNSNVHPPLLELEELTTHHTEQQS